MSILAAARLDAALRVNGHIAGNEETGRMAMDAVDEAVARLCEVRMELRALLGDEWKHTLLGVLDELEDEESEQEVRRVR